MDTGRKIGYGNSGWVQERLRLRQKSYSEQTKEVTLGNWKSPNEDGSSGRIRKGIWYKADIEEGDVSTRKRWGE